ncbi:MAG TPA: tripartite tricarboxylate transporter substrate binding protein [Xanthobacteraceae bacterium]|nr:tripartite tricarboxylate transporter substrate binding protein [Xanthobacteraceae bacterium]
MRAGQFTRRSILSVAAGLMASPAAIAPARAQADFPSRPIRLVVGFAAGGGNDIFARLVGAKASEILGQSVVVENKPGAGGRLAPEYVTQQAPDGYTLFVGPSGAMAVAAAIYTDLKYSPTKSFVPVAMIANFPLIMVISADNPSKNVKDFVAWMKAHPDKANYGSSSPAFTITTELLKLKTGMPGTMIPYKSSNEMILSVIEGQTAMTIADGPPTVPQVKGGKVKALAVTGAERSPLLPDVPSMAEAGYPSVDVHLWSGVFAPTGTPAPAVAKLQKAFGQAVADPGVSAKLSAMAVNPGGATPDQFQTIIQSDITKFGDVVKAANLKFED